MWVFYPTRAGKHQPIALRFTYDAMPDRHHRVAELPAGEPTSGAGAGPGPATLPDVLRQLMTACGL